MSCPDPARTAQISPSRELSARMIATNPLNVMHHHKCTDWCILLRILVSKHLSSPPAAAAGSPGGGVRSVAGAGMALRSLRLGNRNNPRSSGIYRPPTPGWGTNRHLPCSSGTSDFRDPKEPERLLSTFRLSVHCCCSCTARAFFLGLSLLDYRSLDTRYPAKLAPHSTDRADRKPHASTSSPLDRASLSSFRSLRHRL